MSPMFFGPVENGFHRVTSVMSIDFVDIPVGDDATQQLFSATYNQQTRTAFSFESAVFEWLEQ